MKKFLIILLVLLLLGGAGGYWYFQNTYLEIGEDMLCRRDVTELDLHEHNAAQLEKVARLEHLEVLDLRGTSVADIAQVTGMKTLKLLDLRGTDLTVEQYEQLRAALPDCEIRWEIPFQGIKYAPDERNLAILSITPEEMEVLAHFENLQSIDATGCAELDTVMALQKRYPEVEVFYRVPIGGENYGKETDELTLADADAAELMEGLQYLPLVTDVTFTGTAPANDAIWELKQAYPEITFHWEFELLGLAVNSDTRGIDLSGMKMDSVEPLESQLKYFNCLEKVTMCDTGLPSEEIDAMWKRNPQTRFIWNVKVGRFWIRTDATYLMPFQYGYDGTKGIQLKDRDCTEMKYLVDMVCMDFGHMAISNLSFVAYMPHLKYLIISDTYVSDLSPMENLKELVFFEAFLCSIRDVSPLLGCTSLEDVNLANNQIQDISLLGQIESLQNIWISGVNWPKEQKEALNAAKPDANIIYWQNVGSTGRGWRYLKNYYDHRDFMGMFYLDDEGNAYWDRKEYNGY